MASRRAVSRINWSGLAVLALVLLAWEAVVRSGAVDFEFFPAPSAILGAITAEWAGADRGIAEH